MERMICNFFGVSAEAVILWQYAAALFVPKRSLRFRLLTLGFLYLALFAATIPNSTGLNLLSYFVINFLFLMTQYRLKRHLIFFHSAVLTAVMALSELTVYSLVERSAPHFYTKTTVLHYMLVFVIFSKLLFFIIIYALMHIFKGRQPDSGLRDQSVWLLILVPVASVFMMHTVITILDTYALSPDLLQMITLSSVLVLAANLLVFAVSQYNQRKNLEFTEMQLLLQKEEAAAEYYRMLSAQNENQSIFIHDIKKHLQSIGMLNEKKEHEKISAYIHHLLRSSGLKEDVQLCSHELLNAILCRCRRRCESRSVSFYADIRSRTIDFIADSDLTALFGNLLDNALAAAAAMPDAILEVKTSRNEQTGLTVITVVNSSRKNPFQAPDGSLLTDKTDRRRHGFGLKSIRKTVKKYHGDMQMYYSNDTFTFHTIITLKNNEKADGRP